MPQESLAKFKMKNSPLQCPEPAATGQNPALSRTAADLQETSLNKERRLPSEGRQFSAQGQRVNNLNSAGHITSVGTRNSHRRYVNQCGYEPRKLYGP